MLLFYIASCRVGARGAASLFLSESAADTLGGLRLILFTELVADPCFYANVWSYVPFIFLTLTVTALDGELNLVIDSLKDGAEPGYGIFKKPGADKTWLGSAILQLQNEHYT